MPRYPLIQRALHWLIAVMVLGALGIGMIFGWLEYKGTVETFGQATTNFLYKYHKTFGVLILAAMLVRIVVKLRLGKPDYAVPLAKHEKAASGAVHGLLYVLLIAMPVTGWLATGASGYPVEFFNWTLPPLIGKDKELGAALYEVHGAIGFAIFMLVGVHIAAALRHAIVKKDDVLRRML